MIAADRLERVKGLLEEAVGEMVLAESEAPAHAEALTFLRAELRVALRRITNAAKAMGAPRP